MFHPSALVNCGVELNLCVSDENNQNLSNAQKVLYKWHCILGHLNFHHLQQLLHWGKLGDTKSPFT